MTARSINCAYARLSQIVGLNRVVDTTYRMARSPYLYPGQPASDHRPIEPFASFATGANEMSPMDMASGAQTIANEGVHHEPYYVERVERADGSQLYVHEDAGQQILDRGVALSAVDTHEGHAVRGGAGHRPPVGPASRGRRPARPAPRSPTRTPGSSGSRPT